MKLKVKTCTECYSQTPHLNETTEQYELAESKPLCTIHSTPLSPSPPIEIQIPTPHEQQHQITPDKRRQNAQISPSIVKAQTQRLIELITDLVRTIFAHARRIIRDIARPTIGEELTHILPTSLTRRRSKGVELVRCTLNRPTFEFSNDLNNQRQPAPRSTLQERRHKSENKAKEGNSPYRPPTS